MCLLVCLLLVFAIPTGVNAAAKKPTCPKKLAIEYEKQGYQTPKQKDQHVECAGILNVKNLSLSVKDPDNYRMVSMKFW